MDADVIEGLRRLGLDVESSRVVALLPLVMVAWSDGSVQRSERAAIVRLAEELGLAPTDRAAAVLGRWLSAAPGRAEQRIGLHVLDRLARSAGGPEWSVDSLDAVVGLCYLVAEAAGGLMGLTEPISAAEQQAIADIAARLSVGDIGDWQRLYGADR
jgi:tellurite resistance protein